MVPFRKMHGLGNDFIVIDNRDDSLCLTEAQIQLMSHRRFGIGCDQFIILEKTNNTDSDVFMRIHNPDASLSGACGNATRCIASLLIGESGKDNVVIETQRGLLYCTDEGEGRFAVDMGEAMLNWSDIPLSQDMDVKALDISVEGLSAPFAVGMGNPHCVFFCDDADQVDVADIGSKIEHHSFFPERTNVEFVSLKEDGSLRMRVWERSAGITMACGSGACAVAVAAFESGRIQIREVDIELDGGTLTLNYREDGHVIMTGPVALAYHGEFDLSEAA